MPQQIILLLLSLLIPLISFFFYPKLLKELLADFRPLRIFHYITLSFMGAALYLKESKASLTFLFHKDKILLLPVYAVALAYAAIFAIVTNNIEDIETDKISNRSRPLVQKSVNRKQYLYAGVICLVWALIISFCLSLEMFIGIFIISLGYYVYSCRPFRLKRIVLLAKFIIGFNSLVAAVCGFVLVGGHMNNFPVEWMLFIILPLSLAANFIDLKDTTGDKSSGIKTLPVLLGEKRARLFIAISSVATYAMAACILDIKFIYPLTLFMAIMHCYLLYKKPYSEKPVFLVYISAIWALIVILFFYNQLSTI